MNVFAPLAGILSFGYLFNAEIYAGRSFNGLVNTTLVRAFSGICIGVISWLIANQIRCAVCKKLQSIVLTCLELLLYITFFTLWLTAEQSTMPIYCAMFLLPIAIGISFSGKSYISKLFENEILRGLGSLSLAIYLNHWTARIIVQKLFPGLGWLKSVLLMSLFTVVLCLIYYLILYIFRKMKNISIAEESM